MVPHEYEQFFVASSTVAGALIGLLFVAVSVRPRAAARTAHINSRIKAVSALSVFLDALLVSMLALLPHAPFGSALITLSGIGLASVTLLLILVVVHGRDQPWRSMRGAALLVGGGVLYLQQLSDGAALSADPSATSPLDNLGIILLVFFSFGVTRAWEFIGADNPSALGTIASALRGRSDAARTCSNQEERSAGATSA